LIRLSNILRIQSSAFGDEIAHIFVVRKNWHGFISSFHLVTQGAYFLEQYSA